MATKTKAGEAAVIETPASQHFIVLCRRKPGFRRGGRAWQPHQAVPAEEMTEELLAALEGDPGESFTVHGPIDGPVPAPASAEA